MQSRRDCINLFVRTSTANHIAAYDLCKLPNNLTYGARCCWNKDIITFLRLRHFKESSIGCKPWHSWISKDLTQLEKITTWGLFELTGNVMECNTLFTEKRLTGSIQLWDHKGWTQNSTRCLMWNKYMRDDLPGITDENLLVTRTC